MRPRSRAVAAGLLGAALAAALAPGAEARRKPKALEAEAAPAWVRAAAERDVAPAGLRDLVWLLDELDVEPLAAGGVRRVRRLALRILDASAMSRVDAFGVTYSEGDEVERVETWTLLPDGTARRSDPKRDVTDEPQVPGYSVYEDVRRKTVATPAAPVGSVVAFESSVVASFDPGAAAFDFGDALRATATSRLTLRVPEGWGYEVVQQRADGAGIDVRREAAAATAEAHDLAPLPKVELRPPASELLPEVWVRWWSPDGSRGFRSWDDVGRWYHDLSAPVLDDAAAAVEVAAKMRPAGPDRLLDAVAEAYRFAARTVRYVSIQIGTGGYKPASPAEVCNLRYGDCKAKAFLMRAMLESWKERTFPVLAATRDRGAVLDEVPSPSQFNHCILALALPDGVGEDLWSTAVVDGVGRVVFLDPTASTSSPWSLPVAIQGTLGLVVRPGGGTLVRLPVQPPAGAVVRRALDGRVDDAGAIVDASLVESWSGSAAAAMRLLYLSQSEAERTAAIVDALQRRFPGAALDERAVDGLDAVDAPVVRRVRLAGGRVGRRVGDLLVLEPGSAAYGVTAALPPPPRRYALDLGAPREEAIEVRIATPAGWRPETLPDPVEVEGPDLSARCSWSFEDGVLTYRRETTMPSREVPPERYARFRDAARQVNGADTRAVVLVHE